MTFARSPDWTISVVNAYRSGATIKSIGANLGPSGETVRRELLRCGVTLRRVGGMPFERTIKMPTSLAMRGYIAGLFDGEGCIYWRRNTKAGRSIRCSIYSTTPAVIEWLSAVMGGSSRWEHKRVRKGWKPMGIWEVHRANDVLAFLQSVRPFLIIKAEKADAVIARLSEPIT